MHKNDENKLKKGTNTKNTSKNELIILLNNLYKFKITFFLIFFFESKDSFTKISNFQKGFPFIFFNHYFLTYFLYIFIFISKRYFYYYLFHNLKFKKNHLQNQKFIILPNLIHYFLNVNNAIITLHC